jgi:hypothetical protein
MAHSWEIAVKPSSREGWCNMEGLGDGGYYYSLLYPASWVVGTIGANISNLDFDIGSEETVVRLYKRGWGNNLPLEQADKGYAYCDPTGYCEPIVDPDEQEIGRTIKMVGDRQALVLVTDKDDIAITRYFFQLSLLINGRETTDLYEFGITTPKSNLGSSEYIELLSTVEKVILSLTSNE